MKSHDDVFQDFILVHNQCSYHYSVIQPVLKPTCVYPPKKKGKKKKKKKHVRLYKNPCNMAGRTRTPKTVLQLIMAMMRLGTFLFCVVLLFGSAFTNTDLQLRPRCDRLLNRRNFDDLQPEFIFGTASATYQVIDLCFFNVTIYLGLI